MQKVLNFIRFYTSFNEREKEHELKFEKFITEFTQKNESMGINERIMEALREQFREEAIKEGRKEGRKEGIQKSIARLLNKGFLPEQVCDLLDVSPEMVAEVQQQLVQSNEEEEKEE